MNHSTLPPQECIDKQLIEEMAYIQQESLGEGAAACEVCGDELGEGASVVVFAFRPDDRPTFEIGHVKCIDCRHEPTECLRLGVRELVLEGRVGTCTDHVTESSWPVFLSPQPRAVSPADTTTIQPVPGTAWFRLTIARSEVYTAADCDPTRKPWQRPVVRFDSTDPEQDTMPGAPTDTHGGAR